MPSRSSQWSKGFPSRGAGAAVLDLRGHRWFETRRGTLTAFADVAQLVERNLAKVEVAGSIPVVRSQRAVRRPPFCLGDVAEWLGKGLQNPEPGFDSRRRLRSNMHRQGRLAQRQSTASTRQGSLVQIQYRPRTGTLAAAGVPVFFLVVPRVSCCPTPDTRLVPTCGELWRLVCV